MLDVAMDGIDAQSGHSVEEEKLPDEGKECERQNLQRKGDKERLTQRGALARIFGRGVLRKIP